MGCTKLERWGAVFGALGGNANRRDVVDLGACLYVRGIFHTGESGFYFFAPETPADKPDFERVLRFGETEDQFCYVALGDDVVAPTVKDLQVFGTLLVSFTPPKAVHGPESWNSAHARLHHRFEAFQEDGDGLIDVWPIYSDKMPFRPAPYRKETRAFTLHCKWEPVFYCGKGRTPKGPRLKKAFRAARG